MTAVPTIWLSLVFEGYLLTTGSDKARAGVDAEAITANSQPREYTDGSEAALPRLNGSPGSAVAILEIVARIRMTYIAQETRMTVRLGILAIQIVGEAERGSCGEHRKAMRNVM